MQPIDLFYALGDPTRLKMVERLTSGEIHTISTISRNLLITRQGARKHLQILADAKVISLKRKGRTTEVRLLRYTLDQGKAFLENLESQWDKRLEALRGFVNNEI